MLKTPAKAQQQVRNAKIKKAYNKLVRNGAMKTAAQQSIAHKYGLTASSITKILSQGNSI